MEPHALTTPCGDTMRGPRPLPYSVETLGMGVLAILTLHTHACADLAHLPYSVNTLGMGVLAILTLHMHGATRRNRQNKT